MGEEGVAEFEKIVANWDNKPEFRYRITRKRGIPHVSIYVTGDPEAIKHFWWVEKGTGSRGGGQSYDITPKKQGGVLAINLGYVPKTTARGGYGGPGKSSGPVIFRGAVKDHPGIAPRNNRKKIRARVLQKLAGRAVKRISNALFRR